VAPRLRKNAAPSVSTISTFYSSHNYRVRTQKDTRQVASDAAGCARYDKHVVRVQARARVVSPLCRELLLVRVHCKDADAHDAGRQQRNAHGGRGRRRSGRGGGR